MTRSQSDRRCRAKDPHPDFTQAVQVSRFWRLVSVGEADECWPWNGDTFSDGYGLFTLNGVRKPAHELALSFTTGEKRLADLDTCHACDNPICCNPAHLRFDTRQRNVDDMWARGRGAKPGRKLSDADIVLIRERRANGARQKDLAQQFGVTDGQISMIVRGLRWPELGGPIEGKQSQYRKVS